jgi:hypothetical protein
MSSSADVPALEWQFLVLLLRLVESKFSIVSKRGAVVFASFAGAIYAGTQDYIITENTPLFRAPRVIASASSLPRRYSLGSRQITHTSWRSMVTCVGSA